MGTSAGSGTGGTPQGGGAGTNGTGATTTGGAGQGTAGAGAAGGTTSGAAGGTARTLDTSKLPPVLRNMNEEQIADVFETMFAATARRQQENQGGQLGVPQHGQPAPAPANQPQRPQYTKEQLDAAYKRLMDPADENYNPSLAMQLFVETNYGNLLGDINKRSVTAQYAGFEREYPDFKDHIQDIETVLAGRPPATITERDVLGAYFIAKGYKATQQERQQRAQAQTTTQTPSPQDNTPPKRQLDAIEMEVARALYRGDPDPGARYIEDLERAEGDSGYTVKVPVGGDKKE